MSVGVHASVQTGARGASITTPAVTSTSASTVLLCGAVAGDVWGATPVQDSKTNTWTQVGTTLAYSGASIDMRVYKAVNITGGASHTYTLNPASNGFPVLFMQEVDTVPTSPTILNDRQADAASPYTSPSIAPATACTIVGFFLSDAPSGTESDTWGGSFAAGDKTEEVTDANSSITGTIAAVDKSAGTYSTSVTASGVTITDTGNWIVSVETSSSGVTAALTGQSATFSEGTLTPNLAIPLTGKSAAFSEGTLTPLISPPLTGQSATFSQGSLTANLAVTLSGQPATFTPGTLTPNLSVPLTGQAFAFTQGSVTPSSSTDVTAALTGQTFTFSQTSPTADLTATLTGQLFAFSQGTVSPASADVIAPITGQRASFSQGRLTPLVENRGRSSRHQRPWWYRNYDDELERLERERRERVRLGIITIPQSRRIKQSIETAHEDLEEALLFAMNEQLVESARVMQSVSGRIDKLVARLHIERKRKEEQDIEDDDEEIVLSLLPYM